MTMQGNLWFAGISGGKPLVINSPPATISLMPALATPDSVSVTHEIQRALSSMDANQRSALKKLDGNPLAGEILHNAFARLTTTPSLSVLVARLARDIEGITEAYVSKDERNFFLVGPRWTSELSQKGAEIAVKIQDELGSLAISGGFCEQRPGAFNGCTRINLRP